MDLLAVFTTVADSEQARRLATAAVEQGLAACVQAEPNRSTYRWKGAMADDNEVRLVFKTTKQRYAALERWLLAEHPYELPALYALPVSEASSAYEAWVRESVRAVAAPGSA